VTTGLSRPPVARSEESVCPQGSVVTSRIVRPFRAPDTHHQRHIAQIQLLDEAVHNSGVLVDRDPQPGGAVDSSKPG
jgi:hypothetical protein